MEKPNRQLRTAEREPGRAPQYNQEEYEMTEPTDLQQLRPEGPPINPDVDDIVYRAKYANAVGTQLLSGLTYRLARLAQAGRLDPDEATGLQIAIACVWNALHEGTVGAVRNKSTDEETWDDADNTYPDGGTVTDQERIEPWAVSVQRNYIPFVWGNGATNAHPPGMVSHISPPSNGTGWEAGEAAIDQVKWLEGDIRETDASGQPSPRTPIRSTPEDLGP
jgi:hypothetical protein